MTLEQDSKITPQDLGNKLVESFKASGNPKDPVTQWKIMVEYFVYCLSNYDRLSPEAQKLQTIYKNK